MLADLVAELERRDSTRPIEEIWSLDCAVQGDAAILNEDVIGSNCERGRVHGAPRASDGSLLVRVRDRQSTGPRTVATC